MFHFGLFGSSLFNLLNTAATVFMAANLLWLSPGLSANNPQEATGRGGQQQVQQQVVDAHSRNFQAQPETESAPLRSTTPHSQGGNSRPFAHPREKAPRRSFSFHYLDILEWLFASQSDASQVTPARPTASNLSH